MQNTSNNRTGALGNGSYQLTFRHGFIWLRASHGLSVILSEAKDLALVKISVESGFFALLRMTRNSIHLSRRALLAVSS